MDFITSLGTDLMTDSKDLSLLLIVLFKLFCTVFCKKSRLLKTKKCN